MRHRTNSTSTYCPTDRCRRGLQRCLVRERAGAYLAAFGRLTITAVTQPALTQALSRSIADATRLHAWVYAFNTAGAFFGALAAVGVSVVAIVPLISPYRAGAAWEF